MKETSKGKKLEDRLLGDEWSDWRPDSVYESAINAPKSRFIFFSFIVLTLILSGTLLLWYLALPRFEEFGGSAKTLFGFMFSIFSIAISLWYFLQALSAAFKICLIPPSLVKRLSLRFFLPGAVKVAKIFGVSRDRIGNSYVKFHNDLMRAVKVGKGVKTFLLLLPRCLSAENRKEIKELEEKYAFKSFMAFGGDEARKIIRDEKPDAVIGVACERDLISGIQDASPKIPVFGLANKRPEGPCKNTSVDIKELEKIIKYCSNR
ncbi:MAG: DUF116 domain-containing protein [Candidatus Omnitrophota bacterium]